MMLPKAAQEVKQVQRVELGREKARTLRHRQDPARARLLVSAPKEAEAAQV